MSPPRFAADLPTADGRPVAVLSASRELEPGARAAILHAPGLFRLDITVRRDTVRTNLRNLSPGRLTVPPLGTTQRTAVVTCGEVASHAPGATGLAFVLGRGPGAVSVRVLLGTYAILDRGTLRVTAQAILAPHGTT